MWDGSTVFIDRLIFPVLQVFPTDVEVREPPRGRQRGAKTRCQATTGMQAGSLICHLALERGS
jgi:hypothetical protein